jgi:hypothetical protein
MTLALVAGYQEDQQVIGEASLLAEARNPQEGWDDLRRTALETLARGATHALEVAVKRTRA